MVSSKHILTNLAGEVVELIVPLVEIARDRRLAVVVVSRRVGSEWYVVRRE